MTTSKKVKLENKAKLDEEVDKALSALSKINKLSLADFHSTLEIPQGAFKISEVGTKGFKGKMKDGLSTLKLAVLDHYRSLNDQDKGSFDVKEYAKGLTLPDVRAIEEKYELKI